MLVKFSVVVFAGPNTRVAVVGSIPELGAWNPDSATPLYPQEVPYSSLIATYFSAVVDVASSSTHDDGSPPASFRYKFIKWETGGGAPDHATFRLPPADASTGGRVPLVEGSLYSREQLRLPVPLANVSDHIVSSYGNPPSSNHSVVWEGTGPHHDRLLFPSDKAAAGAAFPDASLVHIYNPENLFANDAGDGCYYALPPADFMDPIITDAAENSEFICTTRYYNRVKDLKCIHFNEVIPRIFCGSCPRRLSHLTALRDNYNVGTVFCLQSNSDIEKNWIDDDAYPDLSDRTHFTLQKIYAQFKVNLVHLPTEDMCTEARAAVMAQAAWLMAGILVNRPEANVYVHCNAGVGRAVACVSAFLYFCLGLSEAHTLHLIRSRRPVAYFDSTALRSGKRDFDAKFGKALSLLPVFPINHE
eukprot:Gregarina_sp_Pseudo_9__167@NODE_110_length_4202_cov_130_651453_g102_i0_p2_GENE_NODE_110_length_4202_cov_130_651453_g102_i0NODE_110_length_4202_cov_130_651453_g102_i0_p2_ORF_typecomplete_len417_score18_70DSPc/PF00782_20/4_5e03DSPc/PF00782_20/2_6e10CBM_20/PF00686_19/6_9e10CBM_20/PF00686_19/1_4e04CDKN3/PF05706_12/2_2e07Y_phosphatase2/PF03162_13/0_002Y_phosphatase3/PF13350_6/0_0031Y_phosphatase/PF00102_27/0_05_NODE_110_length_4202_cov_130_651453_g102_i012722522